MADADIERLLAELDADAVAGPAEGPPWGQSP